jgi:zinc transport system substrate-binding protein
MKHIAEIITYELITLAPKNKDLYLANRDAYVQKLDALDALYKSTLQSCKLKTIITNHNAFSYLSDKYDFEIETLNGLSPDKEVSPKDVIRVLESVKKHKVPVVFFENFASSKSMQSIAGEANVEIDSLHPLGNITKDDLDANRTYEDIMKENLEKIAKALHCQ